MEYKIRPVESRDAQALAHIQTESWKAAFAKLLPEEVLRSATQVPPAERMYRKLLAEQFGHGLMMEVDGAPHCIAWWSASRDPECPGDAEIICIHSLPGNWGRGYGGAMMGSAAGGHPPGGIPPGHALGFPGQCPGTGLL